MDLSRSAIFEALATCASFVRWLLESVMKERANDIVDALAVLCVFVVVPLTLGACCVDVFRPPRLSEEEEEEKKERL